jgi:hypothetical protein
MHSIIIKKAILYTYEQQICYIIEEQYLFFMDIYELEGLIFLTTLLYSHYSNKYHGYKHDVES